MERVQQIMSELRDGNRLSAGDWSLVCELVSMFGLRETPADEQAARRRAADRERARVRRESADNPQTAPISNLDINSERGCGGKPKPPSPQTALQTVLDEERSEAVVEHRKKIRKPLTAYAAEKLAKKFAKCPDPNAAADEMVANGWQGINPKWLESKDTVVPFKPTGPKRTWAEIKAERESR